jgi:hypothetical protein
MDSDVAWAETRSGEKAHLVDFGIPSMLARGTRDASDYASACGHVPAYWDRLAAAPTDPLDICQRCAQSFLPRADEAPGVDRDDLMDVWHGDHRD